MRVESAVDRVTIMTEIRLGGNEAVEEIEHIALQHLLFFVQADECGRVG